MIHAFIFLYHTILGSPIYFSDGSSTTTEMSGVVRSHLRFGSTNYQWNNASITVTDLTIQYGNNEKILLVKFSKFTVSGGNQDLWCGHYLALDGNQMCSRKNGPSIGYWINYSLDRSQNSVLFNFSATSTADPWARGFSFEYVGMISF